MAEARSPIVGTEVITDPMYAVRRVWHQTEEMARAGRPWKKFLRDQLENIALHMCPICGDWQDHEDAEHMFRAARKIITPVVAPDRNIDGTVRTPSPGVDWE